MMRSDGCTLVPDHYFVYCCVQHDYDYADQEKTRFRADCDFLVCIIKAGYPWWGILYFVGVRLFGWRWWNKYRKKREYV